jgi:hypothetical protein
MASDLLTTAMLVSDWIVMLNARVSSIRRRNNAVVSCESEAGGTPRSVHPFSPRRAFVADHEPRNLGYPSTALDRAMGLS